MDSVFERIKGFPERIEDPKTYYDGLDAPNRVICRNVIVFERLRRETLQQRSVSNRMHHRYVLFLVLETPGVVSVDGQGFPLNVGEAILITPYQFHHFIDLRSDKLRWLVITFELERGAAVLAELSYQCLKPDARAYELWRELVKHWTCSNSHSGELIPMLDQLLMRLHAKIDGLARNPMQRRLPPENEWIAKIEALIIESVKEGGTLGEVARRAGISERHLRDRFEQQMGISLREYRSNYQFHIAISVMRDASCNLSSVAELSGFNSHSVFTRFIKRMSGRTPRELCRQVREGRYEGGESETTSG